MLVFCGQPFFRFRPLGTSRPAAGRPAFNKCSSFASSDLFDLVLWGRRGRPLGAQSLISARLLRAVFFVDLVLRGRRARPPGAQPLISARPLRALILLISYFGDVAASRRVLDL